MNRGRPILAALIVPMLIGSAAGAILKCPPDSAAVGDTCVDLYEASSWQIDPANKKLVKLVHTGRATLADLTAGGAIALGCTTVYPVTFPGDGNWTPVPGSNPPSPGVYAVSVPGVIPSACTTWFQAAQACAASGKHLARSEEWQRAAAGTPDPGTDNGTTDCNVGSAGGPVKTGSRSNCKSSWGVFDMVGNLEEWVADWADRASDCTDWTTITGIPGNDRSCFGGDGGSQGLRIPVPLIRGGGWDAGPSGGVFAVSALFDPVFYREVVFTGFRCAR